MECGCIALIYIFLNNVYNDQKYLQLKWLLSYNKKSANPFILAKLKFAELHKLFVFLAVGINDVLRYIGNKRWFQSTLLFGRTHSGGFKFWWILAGRWWIQYSRLSRFDYIRSAHPSSTGVKFHELKLLTAT